MTNPYSVVAIAQHISDQLPMMDSDNMKIVELEQWLDGTERVTLPVIASHFELMNNLLRAFPEPKPQTKARLILAMGEHRKGHGLLPAPSWCRDEAIKLHMMWRYICANAKRGPNSACKKMEALKALLDIEERPHGARKWRDANGEEGDPCSEEDDASNGESEHADDALPSVLDGCVAASESHLSIVVSDESESECLPPEERKDEDCEKEEFEIFVLSSSESEHLQPYDRSLHVNSVKNLQKGKRANSKKVEKDDGENMTPNKKRAVAKMTPEKTTRAELERAEGDSAFELQTLIGDLGLPRLSGDHAVRSSTSVQRGCELLQIRGNGALVQVTKKAFGDNFEAAGNVLISACRAGYCKEDLEKIKKEMLKTSA